MDVSIIIPCYNSAHLIEKRVRDFESVLSRTTWSWEIILSDDGSQDQTPRLCERLAQESKKRIYLKNEKNRGRGKNVADAILQSHGRFVGYADADSSTSAVYLLPLLNALDEKADVAVAHRTYKIRFADLFFIFPRLISHNVYCFLVEILLGIYRHDTETGFKFFRREQALALLEHAKSPGWFWDTEIIAYAHQLDLSIAEIPTLFIHTKNTSSTVRLIKDSWIQFKNLIRLKRALNKKLARACCYEERMK